MRTTDQAGRVENQKRIVPRTHQVQVQLRSVGICRFGARLTCDDMQIERSVADFGRAGQGEFDTGAGGDALLQFGFPSETLKAPEAEVKLVRPVRTSVAMESGRFSTRRSACSRSRPETSPSASWSCRDRQENA